MILNRRVKDCLIVGVATVLLASVCYVPTGSGKTIDDPSEKVAVEINNENDFNLLAGVAADVHDDDFDQQAVLSAGVSREMEFMHDLYVDTIVNENNFVASAFTVEEAPVKEEKSQKDVEPSKETAKSEETEVKEEKETEVKEEKETEVKEKKETEVKEEKETEDKEKKEDKAESKEDKPKWKIKDLDETRYTTEVLNLKKTPDKDSKTLGTIGFGKKVHVTGKCENKYRIEYKDKTCWILADYTAKKKPEKKTEDESEEGSPSGDLIKVSSTAYCGNPSHSASGRYLSSGHSIAGKVSWLGKKVRIYRVASGGGVGSCMGTYTFDDTGYGKSTGYGSSRILRGRSVGTIENGTCIDIYMDSESACESWGRHNVYIEFVD